MDKKTFPSSRIESLSDGIFGFAMTLLVINLTAPNLERLKTNKELLDTLASLSHEFVVFGLSFFILATMWGVYSRQFSSITRSDNLLMWITMVRLFFVIIIPFSAEIAGNHPSLRTAALFFNSNILLLSVVSLLQWRYAIAAKLTRQLDAKEISQSNFKNLFAIGIAILACGLSFINPRLSLQVFILLPFGYLLFKKFGKIN